MSEHGEPRPDGFVRRVDPDAPVGGVAEPPASSGPDEERAAVPAQSPWPERRAMLDAMNVLLLCALAFLVRMWRIGLPATKYFDEIYYVKSANEYLSHTVDSNTVHPPLGKLIIALFVQAYDVAMLPLQQLGLAHVSVESVSWRMAGLFLGTAMVGVTYALGFRMFRSRFVAFVAAFLLAIDFLHVVQSRITMLDMPLAFFILLGGYGAWRFVTTRERPWGWAVFSVTMFAIGTPCKWNSLFAASGATVAMLGLRAWPSWRVFLKSTFGLVGLYVVIVPAIYLSSFIPFFSMGQSWQQLYANHELMVTFRYGKDFTHRYMSKFWQWPTLARPIWYHYEEHADPGYSVFPKDRTSLLGRLAWRTHTPDKYVDGVIAVGSPWVWWTFFLLFVLTLVQSVLYPIGVAVHAAWRARPPTGELPAADGALPVPSEAGAPEVSTWRRLAIGLNGWRLGPDRPFLFLILLYVPQVLLWSVNKGFFFYMLPCVPFMCVFMGAVLLEWLEMEGGRWFIALYLGLAVLFFVAYYPLLTAYPLPKALYDILIPRWASSWV